MEARADRLNDAETDYESLRESNIERNRKFLKDIGLESNALRETVTFESRAKTQKKRKLPKAIAEQDTHARRSLRIATLPAPSYKEETVVDSRQGGTIRPDRDATQQEQEQEESWPDRGAVVAATGAVVIDPSKSSGCLMQLDAFYRQLGEPLTVFGKAHVMTVANGGTIPRFSKYSGVAPWLDGFFLWINIDIDSQTGRSKSEYPNRFLRGGECMTWFGGSTMHPDSTAVQGILRAGRCIGEEEGQRGEGAPVSPSSSSIVVFVREVKQPYSCFGRVAVESADITKRPVRMTLRFLDFHSHLQHSEHFRHIVDIAGGP